MSSSSLEIELAKALAEYSEEVENEVDDIAEEVAQETVETLKDTSPKRKGRYARNWTFKKVQKGSRVIYNKPQTAHLTHLLERGHATVNGGRTREFPHIKQAEQQAIQNFQKRIRERLNK